MTPPRTALIIGGTRNLGPGLAQSLLEAGFAVSVFHRGVTPAPAELPAAVERLHGERGDALALAAALGARAFDAVVDTTLYNGADAALAREFFRGRCGHYTMLSTGQVYLVRSPALTRPFTERDYEGPLMAEPPAADEFDHDNWAYGFHKRAAEDELRRAADFPVAVLRLPMVNSARDHHFRLRGYLARLRDGGPILVPEGPHLPLRHVYGPDVARAVLRAIEARADGAFNVGQDETAEIDGFLAMLGECAGVRGARIERMPGALLWARGAMPHCSPFSEPWMSSLDNRLGKAALGLTYTSLVSAVEALVRDWVDAGAPAPAGYAGQRALELSIFGAAGGGGG